MQFITSANRAFDIADELLNNAEKQFSNLKLMDIKALIEIIINVKLAKILSEFMEPEGEEYQDWNTLRKIL